MTMQMFNPPFKILYPIADICLSIVPELIREVTEYGIDL